MFRHTSFHFSVALADVGDLMVVAVGEELSMPVWIGQSCSTAPKGLITLRCFTEFPNVKGAGGRVVAHGAGWPFTFDAVGLNDFGECVEFRDPRLVFLTPYAFGVGVYLWTARRTVVHGLVAVVAQGEPQFWLVNDKHGTVISLLYAPSPRWSRLHHEDSTLEHEDEGGYASFAALANELAVTENERFEVGLGVIRPRLHVIAVRTQTIVSIRQVRALGAWVLHTLLGVERRDSSTVCMKNLFSINTKAYT